MESVLHALDSALDGGLGFPERVDDPTDHGEKSNHREKENDPKNPGTNVKQLSNEVFQELALP